MSNGEGARRIARPDSFLDLEVEILLEYLANTF